MFCVYVSGDHLMQTTPTKVGQVWYPCQNAVGNGSFSVSN